MDKFIYQEPLQEKETTQDEIDVLLKETKAAIDALNIPSQQIMKIENFLRKENVAVDFSFEFDNENLISEYTSMNRLEWKTDPVTKKYRLMFYGEEYTGDKMELELNTTSKAFYETRLKTRFKYCKHLVPFLKAFNEYLKN